MQKEKKQILKYFLKFFVLILVFVFSNYVCLAVDKDDVSKKITSNIAKDIKNKAGLKFGEEIAGEITETVEGDLNEQFQRKIRVINSSVIIVISKSNNIVYLIPGDESWGTLFPKEYEVSLNNLEIIIRKIISKEKASSLYNVILIPCNDIKYDYLIKVCQAYEESLEAIAISKDKNIWYKLRIPLTKEEITEMNEKNRSK